MKKSVLILLMSLILPTLSFATLTVGNVPVTKTGGSTPVVQNSDITDTLGNVGIGSSVPGMTLDVQGTVRGNAFLTNGTGNSYLQLNANAGDTSTPASGYGNLYEKTGTKHLFFQNDAGLVTDLMNVSNSWTTNGSNIYSPAGQNVGIGTSLSTNSLDIAGGAVIGTAYAGYQTAPASGLLVAGNVSIGSVNANKTFTVANASNAQNGILIIDTSNGSSAQAALMVQNDTGNLSTFSTFGSTFVGASLQNYGALASAASGLAILTDSNSGSGGTHKVYFGIGGFNDINTMTLTPGSPGNVGLGTDFPVNHLQVVGNASIGYQNNSAPTNGLIVSANVGINSVTPGQQLDVQGTVRALGFTMTPASSGTIVCNLNGQFGHCSAAASCTSTCTCTCVVP